MSIIRTLCCALTFCLALVSASWGEEGLIIASGAGYKRLVNELSAAFTAKTGIQGKRQF